MSDPSGAPAYDIAAAILECTVAALDTTTAEAPARSCVVPGADYPFDECCDGQLYVVIQDVTPVETFPLGAGQATGDALFRSLACNSCADLSFLAVHLIVNIARCAATVDDGGNMPSCTALDADARLQAIDAATVMAAVNCCLDELSAVDAIECWVAGTQVFIYDADCHSSAYDVLVGVCNPPCPY